MIDNFEEVGKILHFPDDNDGIASNDWFYTILIIKRWKDFADGEHNKVGMVYYVNTREEYNIYTKMVKEICDYSGARAYVTPQPTSKRTLAVKMMQQLAKAFEYGGYSDIMTLAERVAKQNPCKNQYAKWVVDIDNPTITEEELREIEDEVKKRFIGQGTFLQLFKTVSGYHLACSPFDTTGFADKYPLYNVLPNGIGILVYSNKEAIEKYGLKW